MRLQQTDYIPWLNASNEQGTAAGNHAFSLGQQELSRSIAVMGNRHLAVFMRKLKSGQAVTVVVFGASVGQQGGCIEYDPRSPRCFAWSGSPPRAVNMAWGSPRSRSFKGYLVRWFEWLNSTWPKWPAYQLSHELSRKGEMDSIATFEKNFALFWLTPRIGPLHY